MGWPPYPRDRQSDKHHDRQGDRRSDREVSIDPETNEYPEHRQTYRRKSDKQREDILTRLQHTPLTFKRLTMLFAFSVAVNQGANWWRINNVEPAAFKRTAEAVDALTAQLKSDRDDRLFVYFSICESFRNRAKTDSTARYPRFCDREEIQRFAPTR